MATQVVDFDKNTEIVNEFITHPKGYRGILIVDTVEKVDKDNECIGVSIKGTVDGARTEAFFSRMPRDCEERDGKRPTYKRLDVREGGKWSFFPYEVQDALVSAGLRKHGDKVINASDLLRIEKAVVELDVREYGKCRSCGMTDKSLANKTQCRCNGIIDTRGSNKVDKWLEPDADLGAKPAASQAKATKTEGGKDADAWG